MIKNKNKGSKRNTKVKVSNKVSNKVSIRGSKAKRDGMNRTFVSMGVDGQLRDEFALAALGSLINAAGVDDYSVQEAAFDAYLYADAMLFERGIVRERGLFKCLGG